MARGVSIGERIRNCRRAKGMTLHALSEATGFSKGYLSKLESSPKAPPVPTLVRVAEAMGVAPSVLLGERARQGSISFVKKNERIPVDLHGTAQGYQFEAIAYRYLGRHMQPFILILPPVQEKFRELFQHDSEEMLFVLRGTMTLFYGDQRYRVEEGDCVYFDGKVPHFAQSEGERRAVCLMIRHTP